MSIIIYLSLVFYFEVEIWTPLFLIRSVQSEFSTVTPIQTFPGHGKEGARDASRFERFVRTWKR